MVGRVGPRSAWGRSALVLLLCSVVGVWSTAAPPSLALVRAAQGTPLGSCAVPPVPVRARPPHTATPTAVTSPLATPAASITVVTGSVSASASRPTVLRTAAAATPATAPAGPPYRGPSAAPTASPCPRATPRPTATPWTFHPPRPPAHAYPGHTVHQTNGYQLGAYYFSGWSHAPTNNLTPQLRRPGLRLSEPLLGWYDDSQQSVDRSIAQAAAGGLDFFAFDWYDLARSPYATDRTLNEGLSYYLSSPARPLLNFCLTYVDQAPFAPRARDWPRLIRAWLPLLVQPDYVRVQGRPLLIIFSPDGMRQAFGSSVGVRHALDRLRHAARQAGLPGVTVAIATALTPGYNPVRIAQIRAEGYDVVTGYNYHGLGGERYNRPVPYQRLVAENQAAWARTATHIPLPYVPILTAGWDQRFSQREQGRAIIYAGRTPQAFACFARSARQWVDTHPQQTLPQRLVLIFAWNEIGEGGTLIPAHAYGYAYTRALYDAFTSPATTRGGSCPAGLRG